MTTRESLYNAMVIHTYNKKMKCNLHTYSNKNSKIHIVT